jgi:hypothetical protein
MYVDKCRYEIQEQKEVPVWYTGIYGPISSTGWFFQTANGERVLCYILNAICFESKAFDIETD